MSEGGGSSSGSGPVARVSGRVARVSGLVARVRAWWDESPLLGDVAAVFAVVTVGNSVMMVTGLDEPKTGSFAYVHLLSRLGIITLIVGVFHLGDLGDRFGAWRHRVRPAGQPDATRSVLDAVLAFFLDRWLEGTARVFTVVVATVCVVVLALSGVRPPAGSVELYRNLVLLAVVLVLVMLPATRRWRQRPRTGEGPSM